MKLTRILAMPLAFVADAATLGNIGGARSFTQQLFDAERQEQCNRDYAEAVKVLAAVAIAAAMARRETKT